MSYRNKIVLLCLMLVFFTYSAQAMDYYSGEVKSADKVYINKSWAYLEATPHTAFSLPKIRNFTQTLTLCNKAEDEGFLFMDYWFTEPLEMHKLEWWNEYTETLNYSEPEYVCDEESKIIEGLQSYSSEWYSHCSLSGKDVVWSQQIWHRNVSNLSNSLKTWDDQYHYVLDGQLFKGGECRKYVLNYKPDKNSMSGKWNFRTWANIINDSTCIEKGDCAYDYVLDPQYTTNFTYKKQINITNTGQTISNYTTYIALTLANHNFNRTQPDGDDILFTNFAENESIGCYKESFDNTTLGNYSVLISNFTNTTPTTIWMYYSNTTTSNMCPEINNAYLLADLFNGTVINSTVWNKKLGSKLIMDNGSITMTSTAGDVCLGDQQATGTTIECSLIGNTSGVYKSSESIKTYFETQYDIGATNICYVGVALANGSVNNAYGTSNYSFFIESAVFRIRQNGTVIGTSVVSEPLTIFKNITFISFNQSPIGVYEVWNNSLSNSASILRLSTARPFAQFLNSTNTAVTTFIDASAVSACSQQAKIHSIRYMAHINATPSFSFSSELVAFNAPSISVINNETWETTGLFDSGGISNYSINISIDQNFYNNISDVNFSIGGFVYSDAQIQNSTGGVGQTNWTRFNISVYTPLVQTNASLINFNWTWIATGNATNQTYENSSNRTQPVSFGWYVNNQTFISPIISNTPNRIVVNFTKHVVGGVGLNYNVSNEWNQTNRTATELINNLTGSETWNVTFLTPRVYVITAVQMKGWLNISFNGSMVNRDPNFTQIIEPDANHTLDLTAFETSLVNFTMNTTNTSPIFNVNFTWNGTTQIGSNITNITAGNYTRFNASRRIPLVVINQTNATTQWNWSTTAQNLSTNATNQSIFWAHYPNRIHMLAGVTEGDSQTDTVNVTKHIFIGTTTRTVNLEYNQTNVSTTLVVNTTGYSDYNATFLTPFVLVDTTVQAKGWLNVTFGGESYLRNTSNTSQLIININVTAGTNCTNVTGQTAVLNFTFHDEFTNATLAENGSSQITIWNITQTSNQTFGFKFFNTTFHTICLQPPVNFTGDYFLQFENWTNSTASYPEREFWKRNQSIDNVTDQYHLYSILLSNSTDIIFNVQDSNSDPAPNIIVEALKYNISNNSFIQVDSGITDFDGKTRLRLFKADDYYKIVARDGGGRLVLETSLFKLLFTEYFLRLEPFGLTTIGTVIQLKNIPHNLTFDNGTMRAVLTWNDVMNVSGQSCLEITNMTANNTGIIVNKQCSTNISGSLQFDFTGLNGSYVAKYVTGTNSFLIDAIDVLLSGFTNLGRSGLFLAFMLIGTFTAVGVVINPTLGLVFFMVGFIGTWLTGLLQISWLPFTSVIAICLIAAFILKKDIL